MLAIRDYNSEVRKFQGTRRRLRGTHGMGQIDQLTGTNTTDNVDSNWSSTLGANPYTPGTTTGLTSADINFDTPPTFPNTSQSSQGPSWEQLLAGAIPGILTIGGAVAKNLTQPFSTYTQVTPYGTTSISQPAGTVSPSMAFGGVGAGLSSLTSGGMMPLLLIAVVVIMAASHK